jgi:RNA polymerase sigma factor (sigma-70 family)
MDPAQTSAGFQTTHWSMVAGVSRDPALLQNLLKSYWGPIYAYVRRSGLSREHAADLTQDFIAQVVLERDLLSKADPTRGRFRTLLKSSLKNFIIDQHRRSASKGRSPERPCLGGEALERIEPSAADEPGQAFDRQWAATILSIALDRLATSCRQHGQETHWAVFDAAVIRPALGQSRVLPLEELASQLELADAGQASSMIQTVRRKFRRILKDVVAETVVDASEADSELDDLRVMLGI